MWIDWASLGLKADDLSDWLLSNLLSEDQHPAVKSAAEMGIIIYAPVTVRVLSGYLTFDKPGPWGQRIKLEGNRLIFHLPLETLPGTRALIMAPPEGLTIQAHETGRLLSTAHQDENPGLTVVYEFTGDRFVIEEGEPIGYLLPLTSGASQAQKPSEVSQLLSQPAEEVTSGDFTLKVWRLHPKGVRIEPAEKTLRGDAPSGAVRWCGPFNHANAYGFWVFPPIDLDVIWYGGRSYDHKLITPYSDEDLELIRPLQRLNDPFQYESRKKVDFGGVLDPVVSIWTGCIFQTPPGWSLLIRSPINVGSSGIYRIQEGILETDWLPYDIWMNLQFLQQDKWVHLRRDDPWPPVAQLIPVRREGYEGHWKMTESLLERGTSEGEDLYTRWMDYNYKKWVAQGAKEPYTYHRERARALKKNPVNDEDLS